jgi:hypothetical protein
MTYDAARRTRRASKHSATYSAREHGKGDVLGARPHISNICARAIGRDAYSRPGLAFVFVYFW